MLKPIRNVGLVLTLLLPMLAAGATFVPLVTPVGGISFRSPVGISADGTTVVGASATGMAVTWVNAGSPQSLGFMPGGSQSYAVATSSDGSVVVGRGDALQGPGDPQPGQVTTQGFRWTGAGGMQALGYLPNGWYYEVATAVSGDGSIVAGYSDGPSSSQAYRWTQATGLQSIGYLPGGNGTSGANGVSADGSVIVGDSSGVVGGIFGTYAFSWNATTGMSALAPLAGSSRTFAFAASANGSVIVGNSNTPSCLECIPAVNSRNNAVRWTAGGPATLLGQVPGGDQGSIARAVSADGSVIVGEYFVNPDDPITGLRAFIWTPGLGMQSLLDVLLMQGATGLSGWTLLGASGVSADGQTVAGWGRNAAGQYQTFVATFVPIPGAVWLLGSALAVLSWVRRR